ncbi:hypothetical protein GCM10012275_34580 [Longimycelium tulufanense]|uniref:Uncharacterized protein n=1 Tax=Longimycelium tulufanense TaxID=907463 RepID=A0A8J3FVT1_9PSEU|nr:hypothetical protein GCM10012275_34580 [Longimycelium tulufanense]
MAAGHEALELVRGAFGDQLPVGEDRDPVGELVGLLQVLRHQQDRDPTGHETTDDLPHGVAAARIQSAGGLVQEDDARVANQGHRQVEPTPHAAGVGGGRFPSRLDQVELLEQFVLAAGFGEAATASPCCLE